jgi:small subunit ribosomal protein S1
MTDTDKPHDPTPQPTPPAATNPAPSGAAEPARPTEPPPPAADPFLREERGDRLRRKQRSGPVPSLRQDAAFVPPLQGKPEDEDLERELAEAMGGLTDQQLYGQPAQQQAEGTAGRKKAKVIAIHGADVFVHVPGSRSQGVIPLTQFPEGKPEVGAEIDAVAEGFDPANGLVIMTRKGAAIEADWATVAVGMTVEARVTATNKGGLSVDVNGIRGFMPISQIDLYRVENTEQFVNQRLRCQVVEVNPEERNLVVSRRALMEQERQEQRDKLWQALAEGQVRDGVVRKVESFGAFVDLGGVDGLLHVSEMSWQRVKHPGDLVQTGQPIKVIVLKVDRENERVSLGLKQLLASPWDDLEEKYPMGAVVPGKVTRLADFGAFVELEPGIEGLIHISELASHRVHRVGEVVQIGQDVRVQILNTDTERRKISLSLKAAVAHDARAKEAEEDAEEEVEEVKPPRPRTTPLRGGIGNKQVDS